MGTVKSTAPCQRFFSRLRPTAEDVSAIGQHRKFPPHARKNSGTQGNVCLVFICLFCLLCQCLFVVNIKSAWELGFGPNLGWELGFGTPLHDPHQHTNLPFTSQNALKFLDTSNVNNTCTCWLHTQGVMGTPICGLDRYVLPDKVWCLRVSIPK